MKKALLLLTITATSIASYAQQGMGVGNTNPQEMLDVTGAIKIGTTTNNNVGTIRWNGTEFQGRTASGWVSLSSVGALYTAGTGISLSAGNVFSHTAHTGDVTGATALTIEPLAVTTGKIADDAVTEDKIAFFAVTEDKIAFFAVTQDKIAYNAVTEDKIAFFAVTEDKIAFFAVTEDKIAFDAVTEDKIAFFAVTEDKIAYDAVTEDKIAFSAVTEDKIAFFAVTEDKIAYNAVTEDKIAFFAVTEDKIAANAVTIAKLPTGATGTTFLRGDGTWALPTSTTYSGSTSITLNGTSFERAALTGDVTAPQNSNATTIAINSVTNTKLADMATQTIKGRTTAATGDPEDLTPAQVKTLLNLAAAEVSVSPNVNLLADDVQEALEELQTEILAINPTIEDVLTNGDDAAIGQVLNIEQIAALNGDGLLLTDDADNGIFIEDGGNVGIGTSNPSFLLDVSGEGLNQGGVTASDNILARFEQTINAGAGIQIKGFRNLANSSSFIDFMNETTDGGGSEYTLGRMAGVNVDIGTQGALAFYTNSGSALIERMRINSTGTVQLNAYTTNGIVRTTAGNGTLSTSGGGVNLTSEVTGVLPVANGGTGSATQNFVDLTTAQTAAGVKTWSNNAIFNGNVGIGIVPAAKLDVNGITALNGNQLRLRDGGDGNHWLGYQSGGGFDGAKLYGFGTIALQTSAIEVVLRDGRVGINTPSPTRGVLHVAGSKVYNAAGGNYFSAGTGSTINGYGSGNQNISIYGDDFIVSGAGFMAESDARIKDIQRISDASTDLETLAQIQITDYTMKDHLHFGKDAFKKVIAQQVESVYPLAVSNTSNFIPDVYDFAQMENGKLILKTNLEVDDKVKLFINDSEEIIAKVVSKTDNAVSFDLNHSGKVFVYGKEVADFKIVDYEAISMLNVSATQELFKLITELQRSNSELKIELKNYVSLQSDVEKIKGVLGLDLQTSK